MVLQPSVWVWDKEFRRLSSGLGISPDRVLFNVHPCRRLPVFQESGTGKRNSRPTCDLNEMREKELIPIQHVIAVFFQVQASIEIDEASADVAVNGVTRDLNDCIRVEEIPRNVATRISISIVTVGEVEVILPVLVSGEAVILENEECIERSRSSDDIGVSANVFMAAGSADQEWGLCLQCVIHASV